MMNFGLLMSGIWGVIEEILSLGGLDGTEYNETGIWFEDKPVFRD